FRFRCAGLGGLLVAVATGPLPRDAGIVAACGGGRAGQSDPGVTRLVRVGQPQSRYRYTHRTQAGVTAMAAGGAIAAGPGSAAVEARLAAVAAGCGRAAAHAPAGECDHDALRVCEKIRPPTAAAA